MAQALRFDFGTRSAAAQRTEVRGGEAWRVGASGRGADAVGRSSRVPFAVPAPTGEPAMLSPGVRAEAAERERQVLATALAGRYEIVRLLGRGGMGAVYLAREVTLDRLVAIKVLLQEYGASPEFREWFRREARTTAKLTHPNIVPLHAFGTGAREERAGDLLYFVMGYVRGESLAQRLQREGRLAPDVACRILGELADALHYAHRQGVVHRDIKPDNILIDDESGRAMLSDFGIAKVTAHEAGGEGAVVGTPQYMSPEQALGEGALDGRSDLYALGVVGYGMLSGRLPFAGTTFRELAFQHTTKTPVPLRQVAPHVPESVSAAVMRCLNKSPSDRWPDGRSLRDAVAIEAAEDVSLPERFEGFRSLLSHALLVICAVGPYAMWTNSILGSPVPTLKAAQSVATAGASLLAALWLFSMMVLLPQGYAAREVMQIILRQPAWWVGWYPRAFRATREVWDRLPALVRWLRMVAFLGACFSLGATPAWVMALLVAEGRDDRITSLRWLQLRVLVPTLILTYVVAACWGLSKRLRLADVNALFFTARPSQHPFWRQPQIARLLLGTPARR